MSTAALLVAALAVVPAVCLMVWASLAMASATEDLLAIAGFDGLRFDA